MAQSLIEKLLWLGGCDPECEGRCAFCPDTVGREAAIEIERLRGVLRQIEALDTDTVPTSTNLAAARNLARVALSQ